jgi:hypothetical protein
MTQKKKESKRVSRKKEETEMVVTKPVLVLLALSILVIFFNQIQIGSAKEMLDDGMLIPRATTGTSSLSGKDISNVDLSALLSTGHTIAAVLPVEDIVTQEDAIAVMFPTGTPDYGAELEVSYDEPVESLATLARMYPGLKAEVERSNPQAWQRYMNLASKPLGISCEYCCGLRAVGIDKSGNSACGCQHNPALLTVALYLTAYTDYTDGEILKEVINWKTLFFPKDMIGLGMTVAGGDTSSLDDLPGMVGGC